MSDRDRETLVEQRPDRRPALRRLAAESPHGGTATRPEALDSRNLLSLQASAGNRAVVQLLERAAPPVQRAADAGVKTDAGATATKDGGSSDAGTTGGGLKRVAGDPGSKTVITIAWTFDDGPTDVTKDMQKVAMVPGTWFIVRDRIGAGDAGKKGRADLKKKQDAGQEFGIHSMHPKENHVLWFPSDSTLFEHYSDIRVAMTDLDDFYKELTGAGLSIHFVRAPTGLFSEVVAYLSLLGLSDKPRREEVARAIIKGDPIPKGKATPDAGTHAPKDAGTGGPADAGVMSEAAAIKKVKDDVDFMKTQLATLGLHEWGGTGDDPAPQGWEAESEPPEAKAMTDDAVKNFKGLVDKIKPGSAHSFVFLAHDTEVEPEHKGKPFNRVQKVQDDMAAMEAYAQANKVRIEYATMSDLWTEKKGKKP